MSRESYDITHILPIRTYKLHTTQANAITWKVMLIRIRFRSLADIERRFHFLKGGNRDVISNLWWHSWKSGVIRGQKGVRVSKWYKIAEFSQGKALLMGELKKGFLYLFEMRMTLPHSFLCRLS